MPGVRDRVKEIREVRAGDLLVNPANFRSHPAAQRSAMEGILKEVGNIDILKVVQTPKGLMLLDGHLRRDLLEDDVVKVAVLDLNEDEAKKALLTFDRVTTLAEIGVEELSALMEAVSVEDQQVADMLTDWREEVPELREGEEVGDPFEEWDGMPEFKQEDLESKQHIIVHFRSHEDAIAFGKLLEQNVTDHTISLWYPVEKPANLKDMRYATEVPGLRDKQGAVAVKDNGQGPG
jgi:hypothetical protein